MRPWVEWYRSGPKYWPVSRLLGISNGQFSKWQRVLLIPIHKSRFHKQIGFINKNKIKFKNYYNEKLVKKVPNCI